MSQFHTGGLRARRCQPSQRLAAVVVPALVLMALATPAHAQLGRLKKMGSDAIKDAAKDKLSTDKKDAAKPATATAASAATPAAASKPKSAGMPVLDDDRIALVLASLGPMVKEAQVRADAAVASRAYVEKKKISDACVQQASKNVNPMAMAAAAQKNSARITALQNQTEPIQRRLNKAVADNNLRSQLYLQDSLSVLSMRTASLSMGTNCIFEFAPPVMLEARLLEMQGSSSNGDGGTFDPGEATRSTISRYEFGVLRERIALWALLQENPALKGLGKEGVFTEEEQAALAIHAAEIKKLTPLFKSDAMIWKAWSDLRDW
ncbi:hypothetical protein [Gemmatimonas sp.]